MSLLSSLLGLSTFRHNCHLTKHLVNISITSTINRCSFSMMNEGHVNASEDMVIEPRQEHRSTVIFMHGLGDTAMGWIEPMQWLSQHFPHTKWILPTAPMSPVTINMGLECPSWYDITSLTSRKGQSYEGLDRSVERINKLLTSASSTAADAASHTSSSSSSSSMKVIVGGFSQGGAVALTCGFSHRKPLAGILAMSSYLPKQESFNELLTISKNDENDEAINIHTPVFVAHGDNDGVVPIDMAKESVKIMREAGCTHVTMKTYPNMEHSLNMDELEDVLMWLRDILNENDA